MNKILFIVLAVFCFGCNPVKHLIEQQEQLNTLVNNVLLNRTAPDVKDSSVFSSGVTTVLKDTLKEVYKTDSTIIERYYFKTETKKTDTLKLFYTDTKKLDAVNKEYFKAVGENNTLKAVNKDLKQYLIYLGFAIGFLFLVIGVLLFLKIKNLF